MKECCWIERGIVIWEHCMACYRWELPFFIEKHEVSVDNLRTSGSTSLLFKCFLDFGFWIAISRM